MKCISIKFGFIVMLNKKGGLFELIFSIRYGDNILLKIGEKEQLGSKMMLLKEIESFE